MKPKNRRRRAPARPPLIHLPNASERRLVLLDQTKLRDAAASECSREMAKLEKVRKEWDRYEKEDRPAFGGWMAANFGALLTRLRENEYALAEKARLLNEVELEFAMGRAKTYSAAYQSIIKRREREAQKAQIPPEDEEGDGFDFDNGADQRGPIPSAILKEMFEELLAFAMGLDPADLSKEEYAKMFADFQKAMPGGQAKASGPAPKQERREEPPHKPSAEQDRVKELYRILVRRLHPDTMTDKDTALSALWHEVQDAYSAGNAGRLEMLLALTDIEQNKVGDQTSLSQMRAVVAELRASYKALLASLREARKNPAWNFSRTQDRSQLQNEIANELEYEVKTQEMQMKEFDAIIKKWSKTKAPAKKSAAKKSRAKKSEPKRSVARKKAA